MNKKALIDIAHETLSILEYGRYIAPSGKQVSIQQELDNCVKSSRLYKPGDKIDFYEKDTQLFATAIEVTSETTLEASKRMLKEGHEKVLCLNFASAKNPGGGFLKGSRAQEESLARSSGLYPSISQMKEMYRFNRNNPGFYSDYMIYSPEVPVFRKDNGVLEEVPYLVSMITAPAVNAGAIKDTGKMTKNLIRETMVERISKILLVAKENNEKVLVLGAFGCGVFKNNPADIAQMFHEVLNHNTFKGTFEKVIFAVYDQTGRTVEPFKKQFK